MNNTITLTKVLNPLQRHDKDISYFEYQPDLSLQNIRNKYLPDDVEFVISLNGFIVPESRWTEVYLHKNDHVVSVPVLHGGENGKQIGRLVAMIALAAIAPQFAGMLALNGFATGLVTAGVMFVGGVLINALLPVPKPKLPTLGDDFANSQSYGWNPTSLQQQGIAKPRAYGRNKMYGNIIGAYSDVDGRSGEKQYYNALIALGTGPYFDVNPSLMKVNDQYINNFENIIPEVRLGLLNQDTVFNFKETVFEIIVNQKVTKSNNGVTYQPSSSTFNNLEIELYFPSGLWQLDNTGQQVLNYVDISVELVGPNGSEFLTKSYSNVESVQKKGWSLGKNVGSKRDLNVSKFDEYANEIFWLEALEGEYNRFNYSGGSLLPMPYHIDGATKPGYDSSYKWRYFDGSSRVLITTLATTSIVNQERIFSIGDKNPKYLTIKKTNLQQGSYTINVKRITNDSTSEYISDEFYFNKIREYASDTFTYPRTVLVGLNALATDQLSGSLRFSCIADCLYVRVWNGSSWSIEYSNNPAWVLFDVLTQPVYSGSPGSFTIVRYDGIDPNRLDLPKFKEWADWCDVLCPDGKGGTEKRITFNGIFDSETNLWDAAMQVCQVGGASLVWNGIKLTLAIDKPSDPVQLFTVGNTEQDSFSCSFLSMEDRAAELECDFTNIEKDYERDKFSVVNPNIKTIASKVNLPMFGITKPSEVWRIAKRRLAYNEFITRTGSFVADIDAIACTVGDVVLLQSDVPQWGLGGRIVTATLNTVTLDQSVTLATGKTYAIMVRFVDDSIIERTVVNAPGTYTTLTVNTNFSTVPSQYDIFAFGESSLTSKPVRITGIQRNGDLQATINWVEYNATIYDVDDGEPALPTVNYSSLPKNVEITNLTVTEQAPVDESGVIRRKLAVGWTVNDETIVGRYDIYVQIQNTPWYLDQTVYGPSAIIRNVDPSTTYNIVVLGVSSAGLSVPFNQAPSFSITTSAGSGAANTQLLAGVRGLQIFGQGNDNSFVGKDVRFIWNKIASIDQSNVAEGMAGTTKPDIWFRDYEVKIYTIDGVLKRTEYVTLEQYSYSFQKNYDDNLGLPVRSFKIEVRARDKYYNVSKTPAVLTVSNPAPPVVSGVVLYPGLQSYIVDFQPLTIPDVAYYIVYASTSSGFTPAENLIINRGPDTHIIVKASPLTYYVKIAAVDSFGEQGLIYSPEYSIAVLGQLVTSADLADASVIADKIANAAVGTTKIANAAVTSALIGDEQVITSKIVNLGVTNGKIADLAVNTAKITDLAVTGAKIADATITNAKILDATIGTAKIADAAITNAKIANLAVSTAQIQDASITNAKIGNLAVKTANIDDLNVSTIKLADQAVTIPVGAYTATLNSSSFTDTNTRVVIQQASIVSTGAPILVSASASLEGAAIIEFYRGTALLYQVGWSTSDLRLPSFSVIDIPGAGTYTYYFKIKAYTAPQTLSYAYRTINLLEVKK